MSHNVGDVRYCVIMQSIYVIFENIWSIYQSGGNPKEYSNWQLLTQHIPGAAGKSLSPSRVPPSLQRDIPSLTNINNNRDKVTKRKTNTIDTNNNDNNHNNTNNTDNTNKNKNKNVKRSINITSSTSSNKPDTLNNQRPSQNIITSATKQSTPELYENTLPGSSKSLQIHPSLQETEYPVDSDEDVLIDLIPTLTPKGDLPPTSTKSMHPSSQPAPAAPSTRTNTRRSRRHRSRHKPQPPKAQMLSKDSFQSPSPSDTSRSRSRSKRKNKNQR